ncbi:MAG: hypothetical protein UHS52_08255, partial [Alistipes sp.]|nr:hypothetical protein [Alistipes sp.]
HNKEIKEFKEFKEYRERAHSSNLPELPLPNLPNILNPPPLLSPQPDFLSEWYRCVADMKNPPMGST